MNATATHSGGHVVAADYRFLRENEAGDDVFGGTRLLSWRVVGPRMRPQLRGAVAREIDVPEFLTPPSVPQGGAGRRSLDTLDPRVWQATGVRHADSHRYRIWTSHTVAGARTQSDSPRRSAVRWYEFEPPGPSGDRPIQAGTVDSAQVEEAPADMNVFNGAISPDRTGRSAAIHYNISNATSAVRIHARSRRATDPLGAMVGSQVLLQSSTDAKEAM